MAEGRMINQSVATDEQLNAMSQEAMLLYLMTVPHLDRDGLIDGRPRVLWARVSPLQDAWIHATAALIDEWVEAGLVMRFEDGPSRPVLFFGGFSKNQKGMVYHRERPSRHGCPPGYVRTGTGLAPDDGTTSARDEVMQNAGVGHAEVMQLTGLGRAQKVVSLNGAREEVGKGRAQGGGRKRDARDEVMQNAGVGRAQGGGHKVGARDEVMYQDQDQDQVEDQDQCDVVDSSSSPGFGLGGSAEGGQHRNGHGAARELAYAFTDAQLQRAAWEFGEQMSLQATWTGMEKWLGRQPTATLVMLVEWIYWYSSLPEGATRRIDSMPGVIRAHLNRGERAPLTALQKDLLPLDVQRMLGVEAEL